MKFLTPTLLENRRLRQLGNSFKQVSEMKPSEQEFLHALLCRYQPRKIVELGVAAGSSAAIILHAIRNTPHAHLYSLDKATNYYRDPNKKTGFIVNNYPDLKEKWTLYTGDYAYKFLDKIGRQIDFCLLDTVHANPGEILDLLMIIPYLKRQAVVVFHDINYHAVLIDGQASCHHAITNNILMSALAGEKLLPQHWEKKYINSISAKTHYLPFPNIGAAVLDRDLLAKTWELFNLLALPWRYALSVPDQKNLSRFFTRFYPPSLVHHFNQAANHNREYLLPATVIDESPTEIKLKSLVHRLCAYKRRLFPF